MSADTFQGYPEDCFAFLQGLALNNAREWFEANRGRYELAVVQPSLALIRTLDPVVQSISPHYRGLASKSGGSLMRIYRDTRFGRDKTPYKTNVGIQFRHVQARDVHAPAFYVHLEPGHCFIGAGSWHPDPASLLAYRRRIAAAPEAYRAALAAATGESGMPVYEGESLKRVPKGFDPEHPLANELKRIDFLVSLDLDPGLYRSPALIDELAGRFRAVAPWMDFLCEALGVPFR